MKPEFEKNKIGDNRKEIWALSQKLSFLDNLSNPNILLNGNFNINQRGKSSYTSNSSKHVYTVDRWCFGKIANTTCTVQTNKINLKSTNTSKEISLFLQYVDNPTLYKNKVVTFSIKYENLVGNICLAINDGTSKILSESISKTNGTLTLTTTISSSNTLLSCEIIKQDTTSSFSIDILSAKLEEGSLATQHYMRQYDEELSLCKKYYNLIQHYWGRLARYNSEKLSLIIYTGMRSVPTISYNSYYIQSYTTNSNSTTQFNSGFTLTPDVASSSCVRIIASKSSHSIYEGFFYFGSLRLDSEIY